MLIRFVAKSDRLIYFQAWRCEAFPLPFLSFNGFPDDAACAAYLEHLRWPAGFVCAHCGHQEEPYRFPSRRRSCCAAGLQKEHLADRGNGHAVEPHTAVDMVLGRLSADDADAGHVGCAATIRMAGSATIMMAGGAVRQRRS